MSYGNSTDLPGLGPISSQALRYVHRTNRAGGVPKAHFIRDHQPDGERVWSELQGLGLVGLDIFDNIALTLDGRRKIGCGLMREQEVLTIAEAETLPVLEFGALVLGLRYVRDAKPGATREDFAAHHHPIGPMLWHRLAKVGWVDSGRDNRTFLTWYGGRVLQWAEHKPGIFVERPEAGAGREQ